MILVEAADPEGVEVGPKSDRAKIVTIGGTTRTVRDLSAMDHAREVIEAAGVTGRIDRVSIRRKRRSGVAPKAKIEAPSEDTESPVAIRSERGVKLRFKKMFAKVC